jgi:hypothetical protein
VTPAGPTPEELAAIVVAVEVAWPGPVVVQDVRALRPNPWRFSGRWWARPQPVRRERPWLTLPT